jgi:hypothetical protein
MPRDTSLWAIKELDALAHNVRVNGLRRAWANVWLNA